MEGREAENCWTWNRGERGCLRTGSNLCIPKSLEQEILCHIIQKERDSNFPRALELLGHNSARAAPGIVSGDRDGCNIAAV